MTRSDWPGLDRRTLLRGALVATTLAASPGLTRAAVLPRKAVRFVVVDERISESKAFGAALRREGAQRLEVTSGLTALWKDHLYPHWQGSHGAVAGLTTRRVWDGLSQQAHGQFRKARLVGIHHLVDPTCHQHTIEVPLEANAARQVHALGTARWPEEVARMLSRYPNQTGCARASRLCGNAVPVEELRQQLVSWIIE